MSSPSITPRLFKLKRNKRQQAEPVATDPEILALLNQIELGDQNGTATVPGIPAGNSGIVNPGQVRPVR